ncbi:glycoside hydrolase family 13 protein [Alicyclobacillus acidiphilus]|uniref:glycoside hydrolase family 13 protein n=1 Tax=Alicyclobacillus acidiphilus TaxID=182455 RepID=UPI00083624C8|nr:glycoside hydrolase family 13 protein [Alicyclobacillus acidiphilus]
MGFRLSHQSDFPDSYAISEDCVRLMVRASGNSSLAQLSVVYGDKYDEELRNRAELAVAGSDADFVYYTVDVPVPTRRLKYLFRAVANTGETSWYGEAGFADSRERALPFYQPYLCRRDLYQVPDWVDEAVCYQIFPERFANGNPELTPSGAVGWLEAPTASSMHGGDLPGITSRLEYLSNLGVNVIYLTPIFRARSNHKYDTENYFEIDPQFGTDQDLRELVGQAHARGIRVVLDAVFNHCGFQFEPFQDAIRRGTSSPYWDWFFIDGDEVDIDEVNYETFATKLRYMPKLNLANPEVEQYFLNVAAYWLKRFDIDGWRLDVANEIDHVFWRRFRNTVKAIKPDALIVGEVWHYSLPWLRGDQFDGVMNYPLREHVLDLFVRRVTTPKSFAEGITRLQFQYPMQATRAMFNLLGSHDTERVLTLADGDVDSVKLALVCQFTLPGIPMIYYGDELGMEGGPDPLCRGGMRWDLEEDSRGLKDLVSALARLRRENKAMQGERIDFSIATESCLRYTRKARDSHAVIGVQFAWLDEDGNWPDEAVVPDDEDMLLSFVVQSRCAVYIWASR